MATFTTQIEGTFTRADIETLIGNLDNTPSAHFPNQRYLQYEDRLRRQWKGTITIKVEEVAPIPLPAPTPSEDE